MVEVDQVVLLGSEPIFLRLERGDGQLLCGEHWSEGVQTFWDRRDPSCEVSMGEGGVWRILCESVGELKDYLMLKILEKF